MENEKTAEEIAEEQRIADELEATRVAEESKNEGDESLKESIDRLKAIPAKDRTVQEDYALDSLLEQQKTAKESAKEAKKQAPAKKKAAEKKVEPIVPEPVAEVKPEIKVINLDKNIDKLTELGYDADEITGLSPEEIESIVKGNIENSDISKFMSDEEKEIFNSTKAKVPVAETDAEKAAREAKELEQAKTPIVDEEKEAITKERDTYKSKVAKLEIPLVKAIVDIIDSGETDPSKILESLGVKPIPTIKNFTAITDGDRDIMETLIRSDNANLFKDTALDTVVEEELAKFETLTSREKIDYYNKVAATAKEKQVEALKNLTVAKNETTEAETKYKAELKTINDNATDFVNKKVLSMVGTTIPGTFLVISKEMATNPLLLKRLYNNIPNEEAIKDKNGRITGYKISTEIITDYMASCFKSEILEADRNVSRKAERKSVLMKRINADEGTNRSEVAANTTNKSYDDLSNDYLERRAKERTS